MASIKANNALHEIRKNEEYQQALARSQSSEYSIPLQSEPQQSTDQRSHQPKVKDFQCPICYTKFEYKGLVCHLKYFLSADKIKKTRIEQHKKFNVSEHAKLLKVVKNRRQELQRQKIDEHLQAPDTLNLMKNKMDDIALGMMAIIRFPTFKVE